MKLLFALLILVTCLARAETCVEIVADVTEPIFTKKDLAEKLARVAEHRVPNRTYANSHPEKAFVSVSKIGKLRHSYVAIFNHAIYMDWALGRITTFQTERRIISDEALTRSNGQVQSYGGHDLPPQVIREFLDKFSIENDGSTPRLRVESDLWLHVIAPIFKNDPQAIFVAASLSLKPAQFLSHEILHANYYEKPKLQELVKKFWLTEVSDKDRKLYLQTLGREHYDLQNEEQVLNEFYAYTLEQGSPIIFAPALIKRYREPLRKYLNENGVILDLVD